MARTAEFINATDAPLTVVCGKGIFVKKVQPKEKVLLDPAWSREALGAGLTAVKKSAPRKPKASEE